MTPRDRLIDLILCRATEGLTAAEHDEMIALQARFPDVDADEIELTVAALDPVHRERAPAPPPPPNAPEKSWKPNPKGDPPPKAERAFS